MKTFKLLVFGMLLMLAGSVQSQLSVSLHIGTPPAWGPSGYNNVRYYYLPDVETYYDVQTSMFIYFSGNRWIHSRYLPGRYRNYDLYGGYKVPMNGYRGNTPYANFNQYRMKYAKGYRGNPQRNIGVRNDRNKYNERPHEVVQQNRMDNHMNGKNQVRQNVQNQSRGNDKGHKNGNEKKDGNDNKNNRR